MLQLILEFDDDDDDVGLHVGAFVPLRSTY